MFGLSHEIQYVIFVKSIGVGFLIGLIYDIILAFSFGKKIPKIILTFIFSLIASVVSFIFCFEFNFGRGRAYIFAGEIIGAALFFIYPSVVIKKIIMLLGDKIKNFQKNKK